MLDLSADRFALAIQGAVYTLDVISGTSGADTLDGTSGDDLIKGRGGDDLIDGHEGDDSIDAGDGNDTVQGGLGHDTILGGLGDDLLMGADPGDAFDQSGESIDGGEGKDTITASHAADILIGGAGDDAILPDGADTIHGGDGNDTIESQFLSGAETNGAQVFGDGGDDQLFLICAAGKGLEGCTVDGGDGADTVVAAVLGHGSADFLIIGGAGDDRLGAYGHGRDTLDGGDGFDQVTYGRFLHAVTCDLTAGTVVGKDIGTDTLIGIEGFTGTNGGDTAVGDAAANEFQGKHGLDTLLGGDGNDTLSGGGNSDRLVGGLGADSLVGGGAADTFVYDSLADSIAGSEDVIDHLKKRDVIDLSAIDADVNTAGDQAFVKVAAFDGHAGQMTLTISGANTLLQVDVDGDAQSDMTIILTGHVAGHSAFVL